MTKRIAPSDLLAEAAALVKTALDIRFRQNPALNPKWGALRDALLSTLAVADASERHNAAATAAIRTAIVNAS